MEKPPNSQAGTPANKPAVVVPRYHLPDDWSGKGACPVCRASGRLRVQHQDVTPDRMVCGACGTAFEVATAGTRIRLAAVPPALVTRTVGLLDAWLTPAELLLLLEQGGPLTAHSPFERLSATLTAGAAPRPPAVSPPLANNNQAKVPTAPLSSRTVSPAEPEPAPGSEDWYASLAAVIGGSMPVTPPPDAVLADELERALLNRPIKGVAAAPPVASASSGMAATAPLSRIPAAPAPTPSAPEPAKSSPPTSANEVLDEAIAQNAAASAPPAPEPAVTHVTRPLPSVPTPAPPSSGVPRSDAPAAPISAPLASDARALVPAAATDPTAVVSNAIANTASRRQLAERAWKLHEMGNSLASIQGALESSGGAPEDIRIIMAKLIALEQARHDRFRRTIRWGLAGGAFVIFVLLVIAISLGSLSAAASPAARPTAAVSVSPSLGTPGPASTSPPAGQTQPAATLAYNPIIAFINDVLPGDVKLANGPTPTRAPTSPVFGALFPPTATLSAEDLATSSAKKSDLPSWVATLVPSGITIINVPTPSVDPSGPPESPCPTSASQASALFGGAAANWSYNRDQQGWIFILANKPISIRIPANMSAGYLVIGESLEMRSALGPATLHNVNFVAVNCQ